MGRGYIEYTSTRVIFARPIMTIRTIPLFLLLVTAVLVGGWVWSARGESKRELLDQFTSVSAPMDQNVMTDNELLKTFVKTYGPVPTMRVIIDAAHAQGIDCHNRAHEFGRISYETFGDEILKLNIPECHSGFYHGAIEAYFKENGTAGLKEKLSFICPKDLNVFYSHQCHHGLGHGLMAWSSYELPETLEYCNLISDAGGKSSCRTGAFMENIVGSLSDSPEARARGHVTKYLSADPLYPCTIVKDEYKADCYFLQTDRMYTLGGGKIQAIVDGCTAAPATYQYSCFASMGRTVGGLTRGRPEESLAACQLIPDHSNRVRCIDAVAKDTLWDPSGQETGLGFCSIVPPEDGKKECYEGLFFHAKSILTESERRAFCKRVPEDVYTSCMEGLSS